MSDSATEIAQIKALMKGASVEMTCKDTEHLAEAAKFLPAGTDIFIALFPNQTFEELTEAARVVKAAGFTPVPHVPWRAALQGRGPGCTDRKRLRRRGRHQVPAGSRRHDGAGRCLRFNHWRARQR